MATTLTIRTKVDDTLTDVTSVTLSDPTGTYGLRQGTGGTIVVADGTAMTKSATGTYTYAVDLPTEGVTYTWWAEIVYQGETYHVQRKYHYPITSVDVELTEADDIDADNADYFLSQFGESIVYYPVAGDSVEITAVVDRSGGEVIEDDPRRRRQPVTIAVKPDADEGIDPAASTSRDEVGVRRMKSGGSLVRMRLVKATKQDAGLVTWEVT